MPFPLSLSQVIVSLWLLASSATQSHQLFSALSNVVHPPTPLVASFHQHLNMFKSHLKNITRSAPQQLYVEPYFSLFLFTAEPFESVVYIAVFLVLTFYSFHHSLQDGFCLHLASSPILVSKSLLMFKCSYYLSFS